MPAQPTSISNRNFEAWVKCDGKALPVYGVEVNGTKATCWIASQAGKEVSVHFKMHDRSKRATYKGTTYIDGSFVRARIFGTIDPHTDAECHVNAMKATPTTSQRLYFSDLKTTDDDHACKDNAVLSMLGTIGVTVRRVRVTGTKEHSNKEIPEHLKGGQQFLVHEKAKKLGGHHVTLGDPEAVAPKPIFNTETIGDPIVEFLFKYRPQDVLEAQDIIPVSRALVAGPSKKEPKVQKRPRDEATPSVRRSKRSKTVANGPSDEEALRAAQARVQQLETQVALRAAQARIRELEAQLEADD
ncbi:hypothetical protein EXIGLDRAFT_843849 [Exidia glandulosa HHB12029]|uniref:DUF7918 domain-containing protein n=1 Tax=Exidia glandulosa HHB12029 TaxID=1314781 RepID=A0A165CDV2_EXIGL|nr:hypothetical protein EXIGLDRAFT_843849 [Exidia glandulosa HHB12029]